MKKLVIAGCGMGYVLTEEIKAEIESSDIVCGAPRLIANVKGRDTAEVYTYEKIKPYFESCNKITVLFSGDAGFYSGSARLLKAAEKEDIDIKVIPGISCVSYLASVLGKSYDDAAIISMHGRKDKDAELVFAVKYNEKTYVLTSGAEQVKESIRLLEKYFSKEELKIYAGVNLSYPDESVFEITDGVKQAEGLCTLLIENASPDKKEFGRVLLDEDFVRGDVPMTKQEIRQISIGKLRLSEGDVLLDLGCGTGSVAVSAAYLSPKIKVFAVDKNPEAIRLTKENALKHKCENVICVRADILDYINTGEFERPSHAFIGGSGGRLLEIVKRLKEINPEIVIVVNAITLETISACTQLLSPEGEAVFVQVDRSRNVGSTKMMISENRIMIARL